MSIFLGQRLKQGSTPETSPGSPTYDARIDPANAAEQAVGAERLQYQRDLHLFGSKSAAAEAFSHYWEGSPSPTTVAMMGLARQRDLIEWQTSRKAAQPYPGVELGHIPSFSASPSTNPVIGSPQHLRHHAHQVESRRATRARFGA